MVWGKKRQKEIRKELDSVNIQSFSIKVSFIRNFFTENAVT